MGYCKNILFVVPASANLVDFLSRQPFDYLFSVVNSTVLSSQVLALPRRHHHQLSRFSCPVIFGVYATSWAIMNQETEHAITWHVMTEEIDAGDILKQHVVPIAAQDTALSLNAKCYHAARPGLYRTS
ncbi:MAG: formyltransferase family protein [Anaerolineae bacterium]